MSKLKHRDVEVKLSSDGVASVAVFDLEAMIVSLLTDERLMSMENFAEGLNVLTGKPEGANNDLGESTQVMHGSQHVKDSAVMFHTSCP